MLFRPGFAGSGRSRRRGGQWRTSRTERDHDCQAHVDGHTADRLRVRSELAKGAERVQLDGLSVSQLCAAGDRLQVRRATRRFLREHAPQMSGNLNVTTTAGVFQIK